MAFADILGTVLTKGPQAAGKLERVLNREDIRKRQYELQEKRLSVQLAEQKKAFELNAKERAQQLIESDILRKGLLLGFAVVFMAFVVRITRKQLKRG